MPATHDTPLARLPADGTRTTFPIGNITVGRDFLIIAGPCGVESEDQIFAAATAAAAAGAHILRGGVVKPRTSPYDFRGLGEEGLALLKAAGDAAGLPIVTEVTDTRDVDRVAAVADLIQIGSRNMQNYALLDEVGRLDKPILLKRGMNATIEEWLNSAEYILKGGNERVILCERGIRTFEPYTRNTLDLGAVAAVRGLSRLPVIVDPSHGTGRRELVRPLSLAAVMAGCDGLEIEMHPDPDRALSDAEQQLDPAAFAALTAAVRRTVALREDAR